MPGTNLNQNGLARQEAEAFRAAFRRRLKFLVEAAGSQSELARRSGVHQVRISACLDGRSLLSLENSARLARAGGRDLAWMYGLDPERLADAIELIESVLVELNLALKAKAKAATAILVYQWLEEDRALRNRVLRLISSAA